MPIHTLPLDNPIKRKDPVNHLAFFTEDQVLTAHQLNRLIQFFDFDRRETRAWLHGTGIACGLEISREGPVVSVSPGCGLTSDGDLLAVREETRLARIHPFADENAKYAPFAEAEGGLMELLPAGTDLPDTRPLRVNHLSGRVLVLYLDSHVESPDFCTGDDCDSQGPMQRNHLRFLLVPEGILPAPSPSGRNLARRISLPRPVRPALQDDRIRQLEGTNGLQATFFAAARKMRERLLAALDEAHTLRDHLAPYITTTPSALRSSLHSVPGVSKEVAGFQYWHSYYTDLCEAFAEWRHALYRTTCVCGTRPDTHPKHLVLGFANSSPTDERNAIRHRWIPAAVAGCSCDSDGGSNPGHAKAFWERLREMADRFNAGPPTDGIRLTPSRPPSEPLGRRAVPAYYGNRFAAPWNPVERTIPEDETVHSYYSPDPDGEEAALSDRTFLRIEGHLGKPVETVVENLKELRSRHNLSFHILTVQIEKNTDFVRLPPVIFRDIESLFHDYRLDLRLRLRDIDGYVNKVSTALDRDKERLAGEFKVGDASQQGGQLRQSALTALNALPGSLKEFDENRVTDFMTEYNRAVEHAHEFNRYTCGIAQNIQLTPAERLIQPEVGTRFGRLFDLYKKRFHRLAERSIFARFVEEHPGVEHLGGVPLGGTFILVYTSHSNPNRRLVKADLSLPCCVRLETEDTAETPPSEPEDPHIPPYVIKPVPWPDKYDWDVQTITGTVFNQKLELATQALNQQLTESVQKQFHDFSLVKQALVFPTVPEYHFEIPGGKTGGVIYHPTNTAEPVSVDKKILEEMAKTEATIHKLKTDIAGGQSTPETEKQLREAETHEAELLAKATEDITKAMLQAEKTDTPLSSADVKMTSHIREASLKLTTPEARKAYKESLIDLSKDPANKEIIEREFGTFNLM